MMALVYDIDPNLHTFDSPIIKRKLSKDTLRWWSNFQISVRDKVQSFTIGKEAFYIPINLKLAIVKNPNKADIVLSSGAGGKNALIVEVPKSPDTTHPHRQKEVVQLINQRLSGRKTITPYDIQSARKVYKVDAKPDYYYKSKFASPQYSNAFINWLVEQFDKDSSFFYRARQEYKGKKTMFDRQTF
ncbi:MAG TPA: hypothetical protein DHT43_02395 [Deltaproteobacteria bacterium]|nr:MAG: hypothetical protein AUK23_13245 [Deltaproteobacteria bacterium CG2_30_43_15]PIU86841.1 MAG: hypothetical protein COS67_00395 [Deltaproteobacteria bacterium CG06_land_8_20_14_3_00_44_19]PIZ18334.1 MAG: hypothetical protein COY50_15935 [Deltaproteobacteria bacterium CG_4_10_14_0_8_um_filter_43_12]HCX89369.1 hypothetical protein [Deltaproteobacteria bacterium]